MYARGDTWATFQPHDNDKLEERWNKLGGEEWARKRKETEQDQDEQQQSVNSKPRAPPSGVDAIQSALDGFTDVAKQTERKANETKSSITDNPWVKNLRKFVSFSTTDSSDKDDDSKSESCQEQDSEKESDKSQDDKIQVNYILDPDQPEDERAAKVEVMEDNLFDVDLDL